MQIQTYLLYVPLLVCYFVQATPNCPERCRCNQKTFEARCEFLNIEYIPAFPVFVKSLILSRCHGELSNNSFYNLKNSNLTTLVFYACKTTLKNYNILESLTTLQTLILISMHEKQLEQILIGINKTNTTALYIERIFVEKKFKSETFKGLLGSKISYINIQKIYILTHLDRALKYLENVTSLQLVFLPSLQNVNFTYLKSLTKLSVYDVGNFHLNLCRYNTRNYIRELFLDGTTPSVLHHSTKCLKNLTHLTLNNVFSGFYLTMHLRNTFFNDLISLSILRIISQKQSTLTIDSPSSQSLTELVLENLQITVSEHSFNFTNLKNLTLKGVIWISDYLFLLNNISNVNSLYLIDNRIDKFPNDLLNLFPKLKYLKLENNEKGSWIKMIQNSNCSLEVLDIRNTSLAVLNKNDIPNKVLKNLKQLYAGSNPLSCDCDNRWFRDYIDNNKHQFERKDNIGYLCQDPLSLSGTNFLQLYVSSAQCLHLIEKLVPCGIFLSIVLLVIFFLRKKVYTRYLVFMLRKKQLKTNACQSFEYDGFVIYCDEDKEWVHGTLVTTLEQGNQFKLCIHFRNFEPGKFIIDNIVDCMNKSRKIILVLSRKFFKSDWCILELEMAKERMVREGVDSLLLIILPNLKYSKVQNEFIISIMNNVTYAECNSNNDENKDFWRQIIKALKRYNVDSKGNCGTSVNETTPLLS